MDRNYGNKSCSDCDSSVNHGWFENIIMAKKIQMHWGKWSKKVGLSILAIVIAGGASVYADNTYWLALVPMLVGLQNYWKHK